MRKSVIAILSILCASTAIAGTACAAKEKVATAPLNGGFETADLSGWTVEYGNAFDDDCVISKKTFSFANDGKHNEISVNATGNWYLCGKGCNGNYSVARTGAIRSSEFVLPKDGVISMKLAGGAITTGKGEGASYKDEEKRCFVAVYRSSDDKMIAYQTNEFFLEHTEDYVNADKYAAGVYNTDNFYEYTLDLSEYAGEKAYIRIVDNDTNVYYGYFCVDDIRVGEYAEAQQEGEFFTKTRAYITEAEAPSEYEIANGGFETGSLAGWKIIEGEAFSNEGVNTESVWWNENITYSRDGNYHYGHYRPSATGVMRSTEFKVGGSGYISWKLGGCSDNSLTYLRFMLKGESGKVTEVARFSNYKYWNFQFPFVANGMRLLNMVQYYADFSAYLNQTMYIEAVDNNSSGDELGCMTLDSVKTYWEEKPVWYNSEAYCAVVDNDIMPESKYQVENGGFETGDLTGWQLDGAIGAVTADDGWMGGFTYNKKGRHLFSGFENGGIKYEQNTGTLTSSAFEVGGSGYITYLLGGGADPEKCYLSIIDADSGEELARYSNRLFKDAANWNAADLSNGVNLANMVLYKADLSAHIGKNVKIRITDKATSGWGLITCDSFVTYYESESKVPAKAAKAMDLLHLTVLGADNKYQVLNGDFETGDLTGWVLKKYNAEDGIPGKVSHLSGYWGANISYGKDGEFLFTGLEGQNSKTDPNLEGTTGSIVSGNFTLRANGWISFKLGAAKNESTGIKVVNANTGEVLAKFHNTEFGKNGKEGGLVQYIYQFDNEEELECYIEIFDEAVSDWGLVSVDSIITDYQGKPELNAVTAINKK